MIRKFGIVLTVAVLSFALLVPAVPVGAEEMAKEGELKLYCVCEHHGPDWWTCYGVLSNGFNIGNHLCSHPNFSPGDLYGSRPERKKALMEIFEIEPDTLSIDILKIRSKEDIPEWWDRTNKDEFQAQFKDQYKRYAEILAEFNGEAKTEMEA